MFGVAFGVSDFFAYLLCFVNGLSSLLSSSSLLVTPFSEISVNANFLPFFPFTFLRNSPDALSLLVSFLSIEVGSDF